MFQGKITVYHNSKTKNTFVENRYASNIETLKMDEKTGVELELKSALWDSFIAEHILRKAGMGHYVHSRLSSLEAQPTNT